MRGGKFNCVDLFAGAGGFSLAAKQAGGKVVAAIEFDNYACDTYRRNLVGTGKATVLYEADITRVDPGEFAKKHFARQRRTCDLLLGGPPCQGFSTHRINGAGVDDPRNALVLRYFEFVAALRPKIFLMENVPGMLWPRHKPFLDALYREAKKAGYYVHEPVVIDARDYGVPQRRRRVFILGVREGYRVTHWPPKQTHGSPAERDVDPSLHRWTPASVVFDLPLDKLDENNVHMNHSPEMVEVFKSTPKNGGSRFDSNRVLPCHSDHDGHKDVYGRIDPRLPGPTMTTACVNPSKGRFVHPTLNHGISVRHAARFQTFPESFVFEGGLTAASRQIGNAVPVALGKALISHLMKSLRAVRRPSRKPQKTANKSALKPIPQVVPQKRRA